MPPFWKPKDPAILKQWLDTILNEASDDLSDWESKFLEDMGTRLLHNQTLTQSQEDKLEEIYAEKTSL